MTLVIEPLKQSDIEKMMDEHERLGQQLGFKTVDEYENFKYLACEGMITFGGTFCERLGHALSHADSINTYKIISTFRCECTEHYNLMNNFNKKNNQHVSRET